MFLLSTIFPYTTQQRWELEPVAQAELQNSLTSCTCGSLWKILKSRASWLSTHSHTCRVKTAYVWVFAFVFAAWKTHGVPLRQGRQLPWQEGSSLKTLLEGLIFSFGNSCGEVRQISCYLCKEGRNHWTFDKFLYFLWLREGRKRILRGFMPYNWLDKPTEREEVG